MKFRVPVVPVIILAFLSLLPWAVAQAPNLTPFSADTQYTSNRGPNGSMEMTGKIYVDQTHMRMDVQAARGGEHIMITNLATKTADMLMPAQKMYMEFNTDKQRMRGPGMPDVHPLDPSNPCAGQADLTCKNLGPDQVDGRTCTHWQITRKGGEVTNAWVDQKLSFPIKVIDQNGTWQLTNIHEGQPEASLFEVPAGYQRMNMGAPMVTVKPPQQ